jgi:hypothetical protein
MFDTQRRRARPAPADQSPARGSVPADALARDLSRRPARASAAAAPRCAPTSEDVEITAALSRRTMQRSVPTAGGAWDAFQFTPMKDFDQFHNPEPGARGVDIMLRFTPNDSVDAELIGLTQTVQTVVGGELAVKPDRAARSIPAEDAKEGDEGTAIDQSASINNPMYATDGTGGGSLTDEANREFGQHGWRYIDPAGALKDEVAILKDTPRRSDAEKNSQQVFETTALATKGTQAGTYYGSVRWGWRTDAAGDLTKIELQKVSDGVPSSTFLKSAELWNDGESSKGEASIDLPVPDVKVTTAPITLRPPAPAPEVVLPAPTRLQIVHGFLAGVVGGTVKVVDGPHTGITGEVRAADWSAIDDERR